MTIRGIKLFSYQRDVVNEVLSDLGTNKKVVVRSRRQCGKSVLIANLLLYFAINQEGSKNYCLSPTFNQAKKIYKSICKATAKSFNVVKSVNSSDLVIEFKNGSEIIFKSAGQKDNLRGETCTGILCIDEFAYISDDIYDTIMQWTDFHKAVTLMVSTPFVKSGYFWTYYNYGLERTHNTVTIDWVDEKYKEDLDKILSPEQLKEYETILPKKVFLTEYKGEFIDGGGIVFDFVKESHKETKINPNDKLYIGIDWSNQARNDSTVISILNQDCEQVFVKGWNDLSPLKQIDIIYAELEPYLKQTQAIVCEINSLGKPYTDLLKERLQDRYKNKVVEFNTTNTSKSDLVGKMQVALEQHTIKLLPDKEQTRQFEYYSCEYNPTTKTVTYNAPNGLHDDYPMATMFALYGFNEHKTTGIYSIGKGSLRKKNKYF